MTKKEVPKEEEEEHVSDLRKQLRSLLATVEIKKRIKEANRKVFRMKLNGRIAYGGFFSGQKKFNHKMKSNQKRKFDKKNSLNTLTSQKED